MAELGEVHREGRWRRLVVLALALAALLAGLLALTAGGARLLTSLLEGVGLPGAAARQISIATVSTLPPVILAGTLVMTNGDSRARLVGLVGVAFALTGVAIGLPLGFERAAPVVAAIYGFGLLLVLASLLHGFLTDQPGVGETRTPGWSDTSRSSRRGVSGATPADGGEEDDELSFLLESDEELEE